MEQNFIFFNKWVLKNVGIDLNNYKEKQMQRRITNIMNSTGAKTVEEYARILEKNRDAYNAFVKHITINVTDFFRNKEIFDIFERCFMEKVVPEFDHIKIWSAACSTGAEPYSLAMILNKNKVRNTSILATDIDNNILAKARQGEYAKAELTNVAPSDLAKYFNEIGSDKYVVKNEIKKYVSFERQDLLGTQYPKNVQVIVCRNVTIYFKLEARDDVYRKFSESLNRGGLLFTGATETINEPSKFNLEKVDTFIYRKI
ncbi:protein-glutamate O-methyltransferase CheR [Liquorilactobacillus mali]|uniref:protein-glutamate O-methyltransferase n=1 Tax=Liquorilactobacillus mali TaxID=1618 RepID=A0A0R2FWD9_9LACO|nr:protein-glutamate O-methyltransferase CheR [Liquorilactobacillus mali]KRN30725.1 chemotaxis protein methyltransferase CheR [Liquorilactobacillus mali]MDN7145713.1 protein-glutamate O-methyltransferase CheR [Liquorilactobacillus mali]